jgi:L-threonylcarbamoyladenylate synthase
VTIPEAAARLRDGELVAFPTETVYGLGADATNDAAVRKIFALKGRPAEHPLIVHIVDAKGLDTWARDVPPAARTLASRFWPGPLTMILAKSARVPATVTGGQETVGLRCPSHRIAWAAA